LPFRLGRVALGVPLRSTCWLLGAGLLAVLASPAQALTGKQLFRQCEALERGAVAKGDDVVLPEGRDAAECWAYMAAVQDFAATVETEGGPSLIGGCLPSKTTRLDIVRAFNKYARTHRREIEARATLAIVGAIGTAFPCKN
jgi:hypothetical protein